MFCSGARWVGDNGTGAGGRLTVGLGRRAAHAAALYETHVAARPRGWPASGPAALTVLAAERRAGTLAGDVRRLLNLAKDMRALNQHGDPERVERARRRAATRMARTQARQPGDCNSASGRDGREDGHGGSRPSCADSVSVTSYSAPASIRARAPTSSARPGRPLNATTLGSPTRARTRCSTGCPTA